MAKGSTEKGLRMKQEQISGMMGAEGGDFSFRHIFVPISNISRIWGSRLVWTGERSFTVVNVCVSDSRSPGSKWNHLRRMRAWKEMWGSKDDGEGGFGKKEELKWVSEVTREVGKLGELWNESQERGHSRKRGPNSIRCFQELEKHWGSRQLVGLMEGPLHCWGLRWYQSPWP